MTQRRAVAVGAVVGPGRRMDEDRGCSEQRCRVTDQSLSLPLSDAGGCAAADGVAAAWRSAMSGSAIAGSSKPSDMRGEFSEIL